MTALALAVIGANFGDEGKGLLVDYLASRHPRSLVVRFNGGAQAGHTVVTPEGRRHVFGHLGAGSLVGADTFLSRFFIVNPILWAQERDELLDEEVGDLIIDPDAPLTTPYDMLINRWVETARRQGRHGSCGVGIWETTARMATEYKTTVRDAWRSATDLRKIALTVLEEYVPRRCDELGVIPDYDGVRAREQLLLDFLLCCRRLRQSATLHEGVPRRRETLIFEGAQGLLLDERYGWSPHVTAGQTGVANADTLARELGLTVGAIYVSRAYLTRHGPGPFPTEDRTLHYPDRTNRPNEWQGHLRFGRLDPEDLLLRVRRDAGDRPVQLALTCLDQVSNPAEIIGRVSPHFQSVGPTRDHVGFFGRDEHVASVVVCLPDRSA